MPTIEGTEFADDIDAPGGEGEWFAEEAGGGSRYTIYGYGGDDQISSSSTGDTINGGAGNDVIRTSTFYRAQAYGQGATQPASHSVDGGDGDDHITGRGTLLGGFGNDEISGYGTLSGDDGDDVLRPQGPVTISFGSSINSVADGGAGNDRLVLKSNTSGAGVRATMSWRSSRLACRQAVGLATIA
jgi:Ca2+-binding RTX toxin-like protein